VVHVKEEKQKRRVGDGAEEEEEADLFFKLWCAINFLKNTLQEEYF